MARSSLEQAAAKLLSAWGDGVAPASNCVAYVNELRKAFAADVKAREEARLQKYRGIAALLETQGFKIVNVDPEAEVRFVMEGGEVGARVQAWVWVSADNAGDYPAAEDGEF